MPADGASKDGGRVPEEFPRTSSGPPNRAARQLLWTLACSNHAAACCAALRSVVAVATDGNSSAGPERSRSSEPGAGPLGGGACELAAGSWWGTGRRADRQSGLYEGPRSWQRSRGHGARGLGTGRGILSSCSHPSSQGPLKFSRPRSSSAFPGPFSFS